MIQIWWFCSWKHRQPEYFDTRHRDRLLLLLPFFHGYAIGTLLLCIYSGSIIVMMSAFEQELFLDLIQKYKITHLPLVPPILTFLAKHPLVDKYDFRSVRELLCGAAPLAMDVSFLLSSWSLSSPCLPILRPSYRGKKSHRELSAEVSPRCHSDGERIERRTARESLGESSRFH